jgi:hypothetical protein
VTTPCNFEDMDCLEPENYAAVAKQLHETAVEAEERIYCMEKLLRYAVNRETYVLTTTADMGPFSSSSGTDPFGGSSLFSPSHTFTNTFLNFPLPINSFTGRTLPVGMWHVGAYGATFSVGAANDNTYRQMRIVRARTDPVTGSSIYIDEVSHTTFETANGVQMLMTVSGVFRVEEGDRILILFRHGNTSSGVSVASGAIAWFTKLSDSDVVRVI